MNDKRPNIFQRTGLDRFNPAQGGVRGMRVIATGLLVVMAGVFLLARMLEARNPGWSYLRAFAEAAMVGGMADWFAVTALFRHPLGVPVPHTAIIPRNKDRIGDSLAAFLQTNFLTPMIVARRLEGFDVAAAVGRWLSQPRGQDGRLRKGASRLFAQVVEALDQGSLRRMLQSAVAGRLRSMELSPLLGQALSAALAANRHAPMLDNLIRWAANALDGNERLIREMVQQRAGWIIRAVGLDDKLADTILDGLRKLFVDMEADPEHPIRLRVEQGLAAFAENLAERPETRAKVEAIKTELVDNPAVGQWLEGLWDQARAAMLKAARDPNATMAGRFGEALRGLGRTLESDARLRGAINLYARRAVVGAVADYGAAIVTLVSETVRSWDAQTVTDRLESAVGRDLQYIRINGTLVGGLVGLLIHVATGLI